MAHKEHQKGSFLKNVNQMLIKTVSETIKKHFAEAIKNRQTIDFTKLDEFYVGAVEQT